MRIMAAALLVLAAGCGGESIHPGDYPEESVEGGTELTVDPSVYEVPILSELGSSQGRPPAKTIDWLPISTAEGARFVGDALVVDRIFREDANGLYGVRVRVKNTTPQPLKIEYVIRFYTRQGVRVMGYRGTLGEKERWTPVVLEPLGTAILDDSARVAGAEGFRLHIRGPGSAEDGAETTPERLEEIRRQREAARGR